MQHISANGCILLLLFFFIFYSPVFAQQEHPGCLTEHIHQHKIKTDPEYRLKYVKSAANTYLSLQKLLEKRRQSSQNKEKSGTPALYTIPVVVHIIHNNGTENISDAQVQAGIQHLNDAFRHLAPYNGAKGVDIEIEFCLAKQDPMGNATNGINRVVSTLTNLNSTDDLTLKNLSRWDPTQYMNIWLVKEICMPSFGCGVAGYAYYASAHGASFDGIVNEARWFGSSKDNSKIHIHEVGHYLNLMHTFEGGCPNNDCLLNGDRVCDTPPDDSKSGVACGSSANSCTTDDDDLTINNPFRPIISGGLGDQPDMHENYMDYSFQTCQNAFTQGQKDRMIDALVNIRGSLLTSNGCQIPCPVLVDADFTANPAWTVNVGTLLTFNNTSTNATDYEWFIDGVSQTTTLHFSHTFATAGVFNIKLKASNPTLSLACVNDTTIQVNVVCPALSVGFTTATNPIIAGNSTLLTNTSSGGTFEWFVNGVSQATTSDYTFSSNTQGDYIIRLEATNAGCKYSFSDTITVECPVKAYFSSSSTDIFTGGSINFTNTSLNATNYEWFIDNVSQSTTTNFNFSFPTAGDFIIKLVATNGICQDSIAQVVNVTDPGSCAVRNAHIWYFGFQAGLNFNSGTPIPLYNSQMYAYEGCSSIANQFGNLLMYSNGNQIWDRNHTVMPNGNGLLGGFSATQSVQIIPKPGSSSTYYVFTTDDEGGADGLRYSEVEMSLNGGFGDVVLANKNITLHTPVAEKLTAVMHENGCDVWLIAHGWNNNQFLAYLITTAGVTNTPIISTVGSSFGFTGIQGNEAGQLKASPDGKKLAMAIRNAGTSLNSKVDAFEIYDFNASTGVVSNALALVSSAGGSGNFEFPYGVEFSPDNQKVYVSCEFSNIFQFNLNAGSSAAIIASRTGIVTANPIGRQPAYYALQLAPNGKIYVATQSNELGVIEYPNNLGTAAGYNATGALVTANPNCLDNPECIGRSTKGLPPFIPNNFVQLDFAHQCDNLELTFTLNTTLTNIDNIIWDFGDPASGANNTSTQTNPKHDYTAAGPGTYTVKMMAKDNCICTQVIKTITIDPVCFAPLPLTDLYFNVIPDNQAITINWRVDNPQNWAGFGLERSENGQIFESLYVLKDVGNQKQFYYQDEWPQNTDKLLRYYRLKLVDKQGKFVYSLIEKVDRRMGEFRVSPIPVNQGDELSIDFLGREKQTEVQVKIMDLMGKVVYPLQSTHFENQQLKISTQNLPAGWYAVLIQTKSQVAVLRVLVR
jgi:PKD repeat protein